MNKKFKIIVCSIFSFLSINGIVAQEQSKHEFSVSGGLGLSTLKFDVNNGDHKSKIGGSISLGYGYFINDNWSINTGLEITNYNSDANLNTFTDSFKATDTEGEFTFNTSAANYKEEQRSVFLNIPVMGQFQTPVMDNHKFYIAAGGKIGIPVSSSYKTSGASFGTSGTFTDGGGSVTIDDQKGLGFYKFTGKKVDEDLKLKTAFMLSLETGMKWQLPSAMSLYTGVYFDYGLNDIRNSDKNLKFMTYQSPDQGILAEDFKLNSVLQSQYTENGQTRSMTDKVVPMALGLKVRLAFSMPR